jgi:ubiquinol oxidase
MSMPTQIWPGAYTSVLLRPARSKTTRMFHLLIIEELIARSGRRQPQIKFFWLPQAIAFVYYQLSWFLFVVNPSWSYRLNADFEDHAEHEYMTMVAEHPDWDSAPFESSFADDFGHFDSLADVFRQIGHDGGYTSSKVRP